MRGLYISFVIKRRKKIDKIMDFFLVAAIFIFIFTFLFYVQYVQKENKYNSTNKELQTANVETISLEKEYEKVNKENADYMEIKYNTAYKEIATAIDNVTVYTEHIKDIYKKQINGVTINSVTVDFDNELITLVLTFDRTVDKQVDYRYRAILLDLYWVPKNGISYEDTNLTTTWEVKVDGTATKK